MRSSWRARSRAGRASSPSDGAFHGRTLGGDDADDHEAGVPRGLRAAARGVDASRRTATDRDAARPTRSRALDGCCTRVGRGAVIVEPVLGEGGYVVPPVAWLEGLRALRRRTARSSCSTRCSAASDARAARSRRRPSASRPMSSCSPRAWRRAAAGWDHRSRAVMDRGRGHHGSTFGGNPVLRGRARDARRARGRGPLRPGGQALGERARVALASSALRHAVVEVRGVEKPLVVEPATKAHCGGRAAAPASPPTACSCSPVGPTRATSCASSRR